MTASNVFSRNLGSTLGAALLGAVLNHALKGSECEPLVTSAQLRCMLLDPKVETTSSLIRHTLETALNVTFWVMFALALAAAIIALLLRSTPAADAASSPMSNTGCDPRP